MIDIHCHLLPGIDDGPPTLEAALALANLLVRDGIQHVVCTPHVFPGRFENRRSSIDDDFEHFHQVLRASKIPLTISWAGEVRLCSEILDLVAKKEIPFMGDVNGFKTMLLEMPDGQVPLGALQFAQRLLSMGIRPVIVHPERNRGIMERPEKLRDFVEDGCFVQVTAGSLVGQFGEKAQRVAHRLVDLSWVHAVASDAHNLAGRRPRMTDACAYLTAHWGEATAREMTRFAPAAICDLDLSDHFPDTVAAEN